MRKPEKKLSQSHSNKIEEVSNTGLNMKMATK